MSATQVVMHITYRQLNRLTEWENGKWVWGRNRGKSSLRSVSDQFSSKKHLFRVKHNQETLRFISPSGHTCFHIGILGRFWKIFSNISQRFPNSLNMDFLQRRSCLIELPFYKTCLKMLVPHLPSLHQGEVLVVGKERHVRDKGDYR